MQKFQASATMFVNKDGRGATQKAVTTSTDTQGQWQLSIRALCHVNDYSKQAYTLLWRGNVAKLWFECNHARLNKGQPLQAWWLNQQSINGTITCRVDFLTLALTAAEARAKADADKEKQAA